MINGRSGFPILKFGDFKMKNTTILALFAIFLITGSVAAVCAADATLGNLKFEIPDD